MACSRESFVAWAASWANQPRSRPLGSNSAAPVKCQRPSHTSTQVWLPRLLAHIGVPATRAGTQTLRQASASRIDNPLQDARPVSIDSFGLWLAFLRPVEYLTFVLAKTVALSFWAASAGVWQSLTRGRQRSSICLRQGCRASSRLA